MFAHARIESMSCFWTCHGLRSGPAGLTKEACYVDTAVKNARFGFRGQEMDCIWCRTGSIPQCSRPRLDADLEFRFRK